MVISTRELNREKNTEFSPDRALPVGRRRRRPAAALARRRTTPDSATALRDRTDRTRPAAWGRASTWCQRERRVRPRE